MCSRLAVLSLCRYEDDLFDVNLVPSSVSGFHSCSLLLLIPRFGYDVMTGLTAFSLKEMKHESEMEKAFCPGAKWLVGWNHDKLLRRHCG